MRAAGPPGYPAPHHLGGGTFDVCDASYPPALSRIAGTAILAAALAAASTLPASAAGSSAQAQGVVENAGAAGTVPGSYIVILKDSAARSTDAGGRAVVKRYGAKIDRTYSAALNGYSAELTAAQARRLAADPAVKSVVQNSLVTLDGAATTQPNPRRGVWTALISGYCRSTKFTAPWIRPVRA